MINTQMQMPDRVHTDDTSSPFHAKFILQPLEQGYGVTIGNAFRRILLSSIPGTAIVGVKMTDVLHEFQTIPGVIEDVTEIILNLKELRLRLLDKKANRIVFRVKGSGAWTAKNIQEATDQVEVLNLDHHIATLASDAEFEVELRLGRGTGYVPAEEHPNADYPVGMVPIDAIFTPVNNVIYTIDPHRVGQKTDYERLVLDVQTDGSITAQEAVQYAARILQEHVQLFINFDEIKRDDDEPQESVEEEAKEAEKSRVRRILLMPVDELELSVRAHNCLKAANIKNLADLVQLEEQDLLKFRNFGRKSLSELGDVVQLYNLHFGMDVQKYLKEEPKQVESEQ